jgi:hypothetical protein
MNEHVEKFVVSLVVMAFVAMISDITLAMTLFSGIASYALTTYFITFVRTR